MILLVKNQLNMANGSFRSSIGGRFEVLWSSNRQYAKARNWAAPMARGVVF